MSDPAITHEDYTAYINASIHEIVTRLQACLLAENESCLQAMRTLLRNRVAHLLRSRSRALKDEGPVLTRFLLTEGARKIRGDKPELYGAWTELALILSEVLHSRDVTAAEDYLTGQRPAARILELIAKGSGRLPRSKVVQLLRIDESDMSRILGELETFGLVYRIRVGREVHLELGPVGEQLLKGKLVPKFIVVLADILMSEESLLPIDVLKQRLLDAGAPSEMAADRLATAIQTFLRSGRIEAQQLTAEPNSGVRRISRASESDRIRDAKAALDLLARHSRNSPSGLCRFIFWDEVPSDEWLAENKFSIASTLGNGVVMNSSAPRKRHDGS